MANVLTKLGLETEPEPGIHRRALAVLAYLRISARLE